MARAPSVARQTRKARSSTMTSPTAVASSSSAPSSSPIASTDNEDSSTATNSQTTADFEREVLNCIRHVPAGCVTSYGHIAKLAGRPKNSRMVGSILKLLPPNLSHRGTYQHPNPLFVPWHRIVAHNGTISPRGSVLAVRRQAAWLQDEGVEVNTGNFGLDDNVGIGLDVGGGRVSMRTYGWFPEAL